MKISSRFIRVESLVLTLGSRVGFGPATPGPKLTLAQSQHYIENGVFPCDNLSYLNKTDYSNDYNKV